MEKGVLKYREYDGEQSEPIRVDRERESLTRVKKHEEKTEKIRVNRASCAGLCYLSEHTWRPSDVP